MTWGVKYVDEKRMRKEKKKKKFFYFVGPSQVLVEKAKEKKWKRCIKLGEIFLSMQEIVHEKSNVF